MASASPSGFWEHFPMPEPGPSWFTSLPTARPTDIIAPTAIWRWPSPCTTSKPAKLAKLTNYAEYLENIRPRMEARIIGNTSWSCAHGIERWRSDCSCNSGGHGDWNQQWRAPLRQAFDWLRDSVAPKYEDRGQESFSRIRGKPGMLMSSGSRPFSRECSSLHDRSRRSGSFRRQKP